MLPVGIIQRADFGSIRPPVTAGRESPFSQRIRAYTRRSQPGPLFRDATGRAGFAGKDMSTSAAWLDYDGDGRVDIFVSKDHSPNYTFFNNGKGGITESGAIAAVTYGEAGI